MNVLVINCGSSSLNSSLSILIRKLYWPKVCVSVLLSTEAVLYISLQAKKKSEKKRRCQRIQKPLRWCFSALTDPEIGVIKDMSEIDAVGHRLVHGGEKFSASTILTDEVLKVVEECSELAPLHNPANLIGVAACKELMPNTPMVGVFDTAFHQTMPEEAYLYGLPKEYYEKYKIRRYGFHGTSHSNVSKKAAQLLGKPYDQVRTIVCHLGNGASCCAVKYGKSVDTSMGLTPLEGLIMGTRSGDIDPAIVEFIAKKENLDIEGVMNVLNKKSGVLGIPDIQAILWIWKETVWQISRKRF